MLACLLAAAVAGADPVPPFRAEFDRLSKEFAGEDWLWAAEFDKAKTEEEIDALRVRREAAYRKRVDPLAERLVELARPHAADPAAVDVLAWPLKWAAQSPAAAAAADLLVAHHLAHPATAEAADRYRYAPFEWTEKLYRALAAADLPRDRKADAVLGLGEVLRFQAEWVYVLGESDDRMRGRLAEAYGRAYFARLRAAGRDKLEREAVRVLSEAADRYPDVPHRRQTVGQVAKAAVREIEHLGVGKAGPEVAGEDLDGAGFRLGDYRGKVVALVFWATWCGPCMADVPKERELVEKMRGRPFALVGVNGDADLAKARAAVGEHKIPWRSFWAGPDGRDGPIPRAWNARAWPTVYVLDGAGVIRAKSLRREQMERKVEELVREAEARK